jgi:hypothetical protein
MQDFTPSFFELLKKTQRHLHLNALDCLDALTSRYSSQFAALSTTIFNELAPLISENDMQKAGLALSISANLIEKVSYQGAENVIE